MLNIRSIRFRLAAWYFLSLAIALALVAFGSWYTRRLSLYESSNRSLKGRLMGVQTFLNGLGKISEAELKKVLQQPSSPWGGLAHDQIFDDHNQLIYQTDNMARALDGLKGPFASSDTIQFLTLHPGASPLRLASQRVNVQGVTFIIETADPMGKGLAELQTYTRYLLMGTPLILLAATLGGFLISRRALAPVDRIIEDARSITASNLSQRLAVPRVKDELQRLSETLNQMLDRIEDTFAKNRQFTADASHELRAPMTLIHTAAEVTLRRERSREDLLQALKQIFRESKHTMRLVDDLLLLARADSNRDAFEPLPLNLKGLFIEVCQQGRTLAASKEIEVEVNITPGSVEVKGDDASLERLFLILIDNAVKYTPAGGTIRLELLQEADQAIFAVKDNGIGIAAEDLPHIYDRFWRADKVRSRAMRGIGLGLSIARSIVERHGGTLSAQSELGKGSVFEVRLPVDNTHVNPDIADNDSRNSPEAVNL
jgi:two-component system heavy metal sensor histidine kinase CusS